MEKFEKIDLRSLALAQAVDTDYPLADLSKASLLLLNQRPQHYPKEQHAVAERIVVIEGSISIVCEDGRQLDALAGEMIVIPAGLAHAYGEQSNGAVLVVFGASSAGDL
ncbi:cupin domain-containing protein [Chitinimonas sp.]|uniref:cupin domain-containing protein n=1 Tax=Chitinimonas sp. TaxID=1934313 RepID=UPI0035B082B2